MSANYSSSISECCTEKMLLLLYIFLGMKKQLSRQMAVNTVFPLCEITESYTKTFKAEIIS